MNENHGKRCTECQYDFEPWELKAEASDDRWGHPCHADINRPEMRCESHRKPFVAAFTPSEPPQQECAMCHGRKLVRSSHVGMAMSSPAHDWEACSACVAPAEPPEAIKGSWVGGHPLNCEVNFGKACNCSGAFGKDVTRPYATAPAEPQTPEPDACVDCGNPEHLHALALHGMNLADDCVFKPAAPVSSSARPESKFTHTIALQVDEDGDVLACVLEFPGCMTHGATIEEALTSLHEVRQTWETMVREDGIAITGPFDLVDAQRLIAKHRPDYPVTTHPNSSARPDRQTKREQLEPTEWTAQLPHAHVIAKQVIQDIVNEHGAEVFIADGYAPGADLAVAISHAICDAYMGGLLAVRQERADALLTREAEAFKAGWAARHDVHMRAGAPGQIEALAAYLRRVEDRSQG